MTDRHKRAFYYGRSWQILAVVVLVFGLLAYFNKELALFGACLGAAAGFWAVGTILARLSDIRHELRRLNKNLESPSFTVGGNPDPMVKCDACGAKSHLSRMHRSTSGKLVCERCKRPAGSQTPSSGE